MWLGHKERYRFYDPTAEVPRWMEYLRPIVDCQNTKKIVLAGRQVGKSAMCVGESCAEISMEDDFCVLYGTVDNNKLKNFSNQKVDPMVSNSPILRRVFLKGRLVKDNVTDKRFSNGSMIMIRNAKVEQNLRSPTTDSLKLDEIQDMVNDNIYIAVKSMFTSDHKLISLYGTPKSYQNIIQGYYNLSTQNEWVIPCHACSKIISGPEATITHPFWNMVGPHNLSVNGLICSRCGRPINVREGRWVRSVNNAEYEGFRVPEPISPFANFKELMFEMKNPMISTGQKMNEIFGLSWETADRWITESELREVCATKDTDTEPVRLYDKYDDMPDWLQRMVYNRLVVAGCDWSLNLEGGAETILFIGVLDTLNKLRLVYAAMMPKDMTWDEQVAFIAKKLKEFHINMFVGDVGAAGNRNVQIAEAIGRDKVIQIEWGTGKTIKEKYRQDVQVLNINRTMGISDLKTDMVTKKEIRLPIWEDFAPYAPHFLIVGVEERQNGRLFYIHPIKTHDDAVHAMTYANIARKVVMGASIHHLVSTAEEDDE